MTLRAAPLLAALTLLAAPALAQEAAEDAQPAEVGPVEDFADAPPAPAEDGGAATTEPASASAPPEPGPPPAATAPPPSPFTPDQRSGWLAQCRSAFQRAGAALGGGNGLPDACDAQLLDFERTYVPAPDGRPPTIWVRVPVPRPPAAPPVAAGPEE